MTNLHGVCIMHPNSHEKAEWLRMADAARAAGHDAVARRYVAAQSCDYGMVIGYFDRLQTDYRAWLVFNEYPAA